MMTGLEPAGPDINTKYQKLATEYAKLRAQMTVLKKGLVDEQEKSVKLSDQVKYWNFCKLFLWWVFGYIWTLESRSQEFCDTESLGSRKLSSALPSGSWSGAGWDVDWMLSTLIWCWSQHMMPCYSFQSEHCQRFPAPPGQCHQLSSLLGFVTWQWPISEY